MKTWTSRLRKVYSSFDEWKKFDEIYGLHERLGYKSTLTAWRANSIIGGCADPNDYGRVKRKRVN